MILFPGKKFDNVDFQWSSYVTFKFMGVDVNFKRNCLLVYSVIVNYLSKTEILTEEEMGEDIQDIQSINDSQFYNQLNSLLMEFAIKFDMLNNNFYHA